MKPQAVRRPERPYFVAFLGLLAYGILATAVLWLGLVLLLVGAA